MKKKQKKCAQLLQLTRALEDRERWALQSLEALRLKEVQALQAHKSERRTAQGVIAQRRRPGAVAAADLALQAEFLDWSRKQDAWYRPRIEAAESDVDAQRGVLVAAVNRRKTVQEVFTRLSRRIEEQERRKAERSLDERVVQQWKTNEDLKTGQ